MNVQGKPNINTCTDAMALSSLPDTECESNF